MEKLRREINRENFIVKREKMTKFHKIKPIYTSKLNSNIIGQNIIKKRHNLTQHFARNDLINLWIRLLITNFKKQKLRISIANSSFCLDAILISSTL